MSGSNTMCVATVLLETGMAPMQEPETRLRLDMPGGPVDVTAQCDGGKVRSVTIRNVPCFAERLGAPLEVEGVGAIPVDVGYGGMFYALVDATALGFEIRPDEARDLASLGEKVRRAARAQFDVVHPENPDIRGVSIVQFNGPFKGAGTVARNSLHRVSRTLGPQPHRDGPLGAARGASRTRASEVRRGVLPPLHHRLALRWADRGGDRLRRAAGHHSGDHRTRLHHRHDDLLLDPEDPFPRAIQSQTRGASRRIRIRTELPRVPPAGPPSDCQGERAGLQARLVSSAVNIPRQSRGL
jgi:hypothetical protein